MTGAHARIAAAALAATVGVVAVASSCDHAPGGADPGPAQRGPLRDYVFRWTGDESDLPWNRSVWISTTEYGRLQPPIAAIFFEDTPEVKLQGRTGEDWFAVSEAAPNAAMDRLLWMLKRRGTFGARETIELPLPRRAPVRVTGNDATTPGSATLTVADTESAARLVAVRDGIRGLHFSIWIPSPSPEQEDWRVTEQTAKPRPWVFPDLRPGGTFVLAAHCDGRQWIARRVTLVAGEETVLDAAAQPAGGGTVVCDDPAAELLLGGDLPVPPLRLVKDFYRARWTNVPPGKHAVRLAGGKVVDISVEDGGEVVLPK